MRQWTFGQKIAAGYVLPLVMLLVLGGVSFRITTIMVDNARWVTHTHEVLERLASLMAEVTTAESAQRGFVLSGDAAHLEIYDAAANHVPALIKEVRQLTADNQPQQRRLDQAEPVFKAKLDFMSSTIAARRDQGFDEAMKRVSGGEGRRVMVELRKLIDAMEDEERRLLVERDAAARASVDAARLLIWGTCAAAFALVTLAGWLITRSLNAQLRNAVADIQTSSAELQSNAAETAAGSTEQKAAITEASTTLKELAATSRQMAESAQRVTRIAEDTAGSTRNGDLTVAKAQEAINGIRRQVDLIVTHMLDLGRKSQQVGLVLELINELAEQTNILAVNATIESAGAGEAGKRFGVVADEIRKLADRVGASTKEIRLLIDEIRSAANTTVMATEDGSKAVDAGSRTFGEVTSVFRQIAAGIQTTTEASREIELGARQQVTAVDQVGIALTGILQAATQAEISTRQTQETSSLLATLSKKLLLLVQADRRH